MELRESRFNSPRGGKDQPVAASERGDTVGMAITFRASHCSAARCLVEQCESRSLFAGSAGSIDPTFATNAGHTDFIRWGGYGQLFPQRDGSTITMTGYDWAGLELARFRTDGTLDATFGRGGALHGGVTYDQIAAVPAERTSDVQVLTDARSRVYVRLADYIVRFVRGVIDSRFGTNGVVDLTQFKLHTGDAISAMAMDVDSAGRAVVALQGKPIARVVRLTDRGTLDRTFGGAGAIALNGSRFPDANSDIGIDSAGRIVVASIAGDSTRVVQRFRSNGAPDRAFASTGQIRLADEPGQLSLLVAPTGEVTLVTQGQRIDPAMQAPQLIGTIVRRFTAAGAADSSFDRDGRLDLPWLREQINDRFAATQLRLNDGGLSVATRDVLININARGRVDRSVFLRNAPTDFRTGYYGSGLRFDGGMIALRDTGNAYGQWPRVAELRVLRSDGAVVPLATTAQPIALSFHFVNSRGEMIFGWTDGTYGPGRVRAGTDGFVEPVPGVARFELESPGDSAYLLEESPDGFFATWSWTNVNPDPSLDDTHYLSAYRWDEKGSLSWTHELSAVVQSPSARAIPHGMGYGSGGTWGTDRHLFLADGRDRVMYEDPQYLREIVRSPSSAWTYSSLNGTVVALHVGAFDIALRSVPVQTRDFGVDVVAVRDDGRLTYAGYHTVGRALPDWSPDPTFCTIALPTDGLVSGWQAFEDRAGRVIIYGVRSSNGADAGDIELRRYRADGMPDLTFGTNGVAVVDTGSGLAIVGLANPGEHALKLAEDPQGRLLLSGTYKDGRGTQPTTAAWFSTRLIAD